MKRVLITGATGFIGSNLARRLVQEGIDVHVVLRPQADLESLRDISKKISVHEHDGTTEGLLEIMGSAKPDMVFHLAAFFVAEHNSTDIEPLIRSNILFGTQLLEAMMKANVHYLVNTGTHWQHYHDEKYNPVDLYAATKQAFESLVAYFSQATPLRMITLKLVDTYGPNDLRPKLFSLLKHAAKTGEGLKMSPGEQLLGLVYIDDVVDAFVCGMNMIQGMPEHFQDDFVIAPDKLYTLREVVSLYEKISGTKVNIQWGARAYRNREMMVPYKAKTLPGWKTKVDLSAGILLMLEDKD
ncbi:MAG: NAD-dependent epimerase/dehydratase family protein [Thermincolia bacterium]